VAAEQVVAVVEQEVIAAPEQAASVRAVIAVEEVVAEPVAVAVQKQPATDLAAAHK
jgi:hypothetical protein